MADVDGLGQDRRAMMGNAVGHPGDMKSLGGAKVPQVPEPGMGSEGSTKGREDRMGLLQRFVSRVLVTQRGPDHRPDRNFVGGGQFGQVRMLERAPAARFPEIDEDVSGGGLKQNAVAANQIGNWPAGWIRSYRVYAEQLDELTALIERSDPAIVP